MEVSRQVRVHKGRACEVQHEALQNQGVPMGIYHHQDKNGTVTLCLYRILALTPDCLLIFEPNVENPENLKLDTWCTLK